MISTGKLSARTSAAAPAAAAVIRVTLIGEGRLSRAGLRMLIEHHPDIRVVAEGNTLADTMSDASLETDIVLLDTDARADEVIETIQPIRGEYDMARILIVAQHCDRETGERFVLAGAGGVVLKDQSPEHLVQAIRKVRDGELWVDRATAASLIAGLTTGRRATAADPERSKIDSLTQREREVIALIANGMTNKAIAENMKISDNTVRHHLTSIFEKLGAHHRLALLVYAYRHKLALPPT